MLPFRNNLLDELAGYIQFDDSLFQVYEMDSIAFREDLICHAGMPSARLVPEVSPRFQKLLDISCIWQTSTPFCLDNYITSKIV